MSKVPAYATWVYTLGAERVQRKTPGFDGCEEILAFISIKEARGEKTKVTDLVQSLMFGTGPTVNRKVMLLSGLGFIAISKCRDDARAKNLALTQSGLRILHERTNQMKQIVTGA